MKRIKIVGKGHKRIVHKGPMPERIDPFFVIAKALGAEIISTNNSRHIINILNFNMSNKMTKQEVVDKRNNAIAEIVKEIEGQILNEQWGRAGTTKQLDITLDYEDLDKIVLGVLDKTAYHIRIKYSESARRALYWHIVQ